jgi:HAD superfamily hydrolase (TIGR01484 family)
MRKAFASDFDSTLYFREGFHQEDIKAIRKAQKEGVPFGICTGRSLHGVTVPSKDHIHYDFFIVATGSLIVDDQGKEIYSHTIAKKDVIAITKEYQNKYKIAYNGGYDFYSLSDEYEVVIQVKSLDELPDEMHGISFLSESSDVADGICNYLNKTYEVSAFHNGPFVDITAKGCSKGIALQFLKDYYHIDLIGGMGDSYNDLPLLEAVDCSYTFPSSPIELTSKVDKVTPGIAASLEDFLQQ